MDEDGAGRRGGRGAKFREKRFWFFFWFCEALTVQTRVLFNFISYCWTTKMNFFNLENGHDTNLKVFLDTRCHGVFVLALLTLQPATLPFNKFRPSL